jgi:hypothetical protein
MSGPLPRRTLSGCRRALGQARLSPLILLRFTLALRYNSPNSEEEK